MDSIKSLMEKNQYSLVIKLTENATDVDGLFYRIGALLGLGKGEDALKCLIKNREILKKRLAFLIKVHMDLLCILSKYDEAYEELNYYKALPYESQEVEEILKAMPKYIRQEEKAEYERKNISDEDIKHKLMSMNKEELLMGLNMANTRDINIFLNEFQNIFTGFPFQAVRSYALMLLVQRNVDRNFKFLSSKGMIEVNPSKLTPPFVGQDFKNLTKRLQNEFKNPSLSDNAINILSSYIIQIYPEKMDFDEDYLVGVLYYLSANALRVKDIKDKYDYCLEHDLSIDKFNEIYNIFTKSLTNF